MTGPGPFAGRHLVLIGLRGSGKTTAGRLAAQRLNIAFADLDALVLREMGCASVEQAWREQGERAFRAAEAACLARALTHKRDDVLALGGGTPMIDAARHVLQASVVAGVVVGPVYLHASFEVLAKRLEDDPGDRPPLTDRGLSADDLVAEVRGVYEKRDGVYQALAQEVVEVGGLTTDEVVDRLVEVWGSQDMISA
ncbi:MAG: AAA family ATPase [Phycisphaeraceae bacterium]|nr:AAA family ATPase [Phycisphaeraceae bacterium]